MSKKNESLPTGPDRTERELQIEAAIGAKLDEIAAAHESRVMEGVAEMIERHSSVDAGSIPSTVNRSGEAVIRTESPTAGLYRSLPLAPAERRFRNPDADHWMREWAVGAVENNGAQRMQAEAKLDALYPDLKARADGLEGAADSAGGFAAGTGGVLMPRVMEELVAINRDANAKMHLWATNYSMTAQEHNVPTGAAMTAFMVGEATSPVTQGEPTFAQVPLVAHRGAAKAIMGNDLLEDAAVNIVSFITQRGGAVLGVLEDSEFFSAGTGSAPHVTKLAGTAHGEVSSAELKYTDVVNMFTGVPQQYRENSRWLVSSNVLGLMANVRDGNGRPFYQSLLDPPMMLTDDANGGAMAGAQGTLLGRPLHEAALPAGDIYFGDVGANYAIGRRHGIRVDVSREFLFDTFRTIFLIHQRIAGNNLDTVAGEQAAGIVSATSL